MRPVFFLLADEHGVVTRRIVKHELEWIPPAMMAIESFFYVERWAHRGRGEKMREKRNAKTGTSLDIRQVHTSDFLTL